VRGRNPSDGVLNELDEPVVLRNPRKIGLGVVEGIHLWGDEPDKVKQFVSAFVVPVRFASRVEW
jgi:hypothetical protein